MFTSRTHIELPTKYDGNVIVCNTVAKTYFNQISNNWTTILRVDKEYSDFDGRHLSTTIVVKSKGNITRYKIMLSK